MVWLEAIAGTDVCKHLGCKKGRRLSTHQLLVLVAGFGRRIGDAHQQYKHSSLLLCLVFSCSSVCHGDFRKLLK